MFAEIILNTTSKELNKVFDYIVPKEMEETLKLGDRVLIPFGKSDKLIDGIVTNIKSESQFAKKEIAEIKNSYLTKEKIDFARLMAKRYFCNEFECIKLMLPPGTISKEINNWIKDKQENFVYLAKNEEDIKKDIISKKIKSVKHIELLEYLIKLNKDLKSKDTVKNNSSNKLSIIEKELGISRSIMKTVEKNGYIEIKLENVRRNPFKEKKVEKDKEYDLNEEQQYAYFRVNTCIKNNEFQEFLLYGVTGSRKNRSIFATYKECFRRK